MKKHYLKVSTDVGVIPLVIRSNEKQNIEELVQKNYNINSIISVSNDPFDCYTGKILSSPIHALGTIGGGLKSSKRYNTVD